MNLSLLIAEDDPELCDLFQRYCTTHGYNVEITSDALSCVERLHQAMPAACLFDLDLRWYDGDGGFAWLREQLAATDVPVVLMGTPNGSPDAGIAIEPPIVKFLPKPLALPILLESVRAAVAKTDPEEEDFT